MTMTLEIWLLQQFSNTTVWGFCIYLLSSIVSHLVCIASHIKSPLKGYMSPPWV